MNLVLSAETQKMLERQMRVGGYRSAEEAVRAGLAYLEQQETAGDFAAGEMAALLGEGDAEIERGDVIDGEQALEARRRRRAEHRGGSGT